jgi:uncharacterized protein
MELFLLFVRNPTYNEVFKECRIKNFLILLLFYFVTTIPIGLLLFFLLKFLNLTHKAVDLSFQEKILYGILLSPIIEEILFRLILVFNRKNLLILKLTIFSLLIFFVIKESIVKVIFFFLLLFLLIFVYAYKDRCQYFFRKNFRIFFFLITGLFAFLHLFNFLGISLSNSFYLLLFIIPQFILGLLLGYIRITYGIQYSIIFHVLVNCFIII